MSDEYRELFRGTLTREEFAEIDWDKIQVDRTVCKMSFDEDGNAVFTEVPQDNGQQGQTKG